MTNICCSSSLGTGQRLRTNWAKHASSV